MKLFRVCHVAMWTAAANLLVLLAWAVLEDGGDLFLVWSLSHSLILCDAIACLHVMEVVRQERTHEARTWEEKLARAVLEA